MNRTFPSKTLKRCLWYIQRSLFLSFTADSNRNPGFVGDAMDLVLRSWNNEHICSYLLPSSLSRSVAPLPTPHLCLHIFYSHSIHRRCLDHHFSMFASWELLENRHWVHSSKLRWFREVVVHSVRLDLILWYCTVYHANEISMAYVPLTCLWGNLSTNWIAELSIPKWQRIQVMILIGLGAL